MTPCPTSILFRAPSAAAWPRIVSALAVTAALLATGDRALAASGDLDETFGNEGVAVAPIESSLAADLVRLPDGKLLVAGRTYAKNAQTLALARFDANGVLDPTFDGDGLVTTDVSEFEEFVAQVLVQTDGKIVVVGQVETVEDGSDYDTLLVRYEADGSIDAGFGSGGFVITSLGTATDTPFAGALQADDKILVVGGAVSTQTTSSDLFVLRYESDGDLDATFGTGGLATFDFAGRGDSGNAVAVQPDGKIVVAGASFNGPLFLDGGIGTLTRLDSSGVPDPGFGTGGFVILAIDTINFFRGLVLQPDGKIVALGATGPLNVINRLFRYETNGNPDGGFAGDPIPVAPRNSHVLLADGKFAVPGGLGQFFEVARMNDDGSLDTTFGMGGSIAVAAGISAIANVAAGEPGGDIFLAGTSRPVGGKRGDYQITVARLDGASAACATDADCGPCERCGGSVCEIGPRSGCTDASSGDALLKLRQGYGKRTSLALRWRGAVPSFDPTTTDDVGLCLFHQGKRKLKAVAPASGLCRGLPCWTGSAGDFEYDDRDATPHGIRRIRVESDQVKLKAKGEELASSPQGFPETYTLGLPGPPFLLQLQASNGACLEATFVDGRVTAYRFIGSND